MKKLLIAISIFLSAGRLFATDGTVVVIDKLAPKNGAFTGIVDSSQTLTNTTNFNNNLSGSDNTVQKALDTLDNASFGGGSGSPDGLGPHVATKTVTANFGITGSTLNLSQSITMGGVSISTHLAGAALLPSNSTWYYGYNNRFWILQDSNLSNSASVFNISTTKDYTLTDSVSGTNSNEIYGNLDGDYTWGVHMNLPSSAKGQLGFASGAHGADGSAFVAVADSTNSYVFRGWHSGSTHNGDLLRLDSETTFASSAYPSQTPSYSGTFGGNYVAFYDRSLPMFKVGSDGSAYSYDSTGTEYIKTYHNGLGGIIQTNAESILLLPAGGTTYTYSSGLTGVFGIAVANNNDVQFISFGSTIAVGLGNNQINLAGAVNVSSNMVVTGNATFYQNAPALISSVTVMNQLKVLGPGTDTMTIYHNGNAGLIQVNNDPIALLPDGGTTYFYNDALTGLLQIIVDSSGNVLFDVTGSSYTYGLSGTDRHIFNGSVSVSSITANAFYVKNTLGVITATMTETNLLIPDIYVHSINLLPDGPAFMTYPPSAYFGFTDGAIGTVYLNAPNPVVAAETQFYLPSTFTTGGYLKATAISATEAALSFDTPAGGGGDMILASTQTVTGAKTFTSTITYSPAPSLSGGLEIKRSSVTFDSGSNDPVFNWSTNGQLNFTVSTVNVSGKIAATYVTTIDPPAGVFATISGVSAGDMGSASGNVMVGTYGQAVTTRTGSVSGQHAIGTLGLAQDNTVAGGTADLIGTEGRTIGAGQADYIGALGFLDYRGTGAGTNTDLVAIEARSQITTNGVTAHSTGTMKIINIPAPTGKGRTDDVSWSLYGASTYPYYVNGSVGISSANPVNKFVVKTTNAQMSVGEPTAGIAGLTFENGPITTSNYNLAGAANSVYLNRPTGGSVFIAENNTAQIAVSPTSGDMVSVGGFAGTYLNAPLVLTSSATVSSILTLGEVIRISSSGVFTIYKSTGNNDSARGRALIRGASALAQGDTLIVHPGTYSVISSIRMLEHTSIVGVGMPTIFDTTLTDPLIIVASNNVTVDGLRIRPNTTGIGLHSTVTSTATNVVIRNVNIQPNSTTANAVMWSAISGGGTTEHYIIADIYNSVLYGGSITGFGGYAYLTTNGKIRMYDCDVFGATDGILFVGNGTSEIYGGKYRSVLDAMTSGLSHTMNIFGSYAQGDQADIYSDDGNVNIFSAISANTGIVGNNIKHSTLSVVGDINLFYDDAYSASGWNGSTEVPTKNALRDKIETLTGGSPDSLGTHVATKTITAGFGINTATLTITALNCTGNLNGGALTANASGVISCSDDDGGAGGGDAVKTATQTFSGANTFTSTITYTPAPSLSGGLEIKRSSITFDSGSSDPAINWATDGQFNISATTTNFGGKVTATTLQSPAGSGLASAVYGLYAADVGSDTGAVMAGVYGQAVNVRTGASTSQHAIGALGLAQDVANATSDIIGMEGRTIGQGVAAKYIGGLGFLDYRGTAAGSSTELIGLEARGQITSNGVTATSTGTMKLVNIPAPTGKGKTDDMSWSLYGASTYSYYMNGKVGISSANPANNLVVKTANAVASIGEPTAGISAITFENGPITLANYALAGAAGSVYMNRASGGTIFFAENNVGQVTISPTSGDVTTIGKVVAVSTVSGAGVSASTGAYSNVLKVKGRDVFSGEVLFSTDPYTNTSNTAANLKNIEGLRATIEPNTTYFFEFVIYSSAAVTTTGIGITVSTQSLVPVKFNASYTVQTGTTTKENQLKNGGGTIFVASASGGPGPFGVKETSITGNIVTGNTGGNLQVKFISEVNASGVTVMPGCYGRVYPLISP